MKTWNEFVQEKEKEQFKTKVLNKVQDKKSVGRANFFNKLKKLPHYKK